MPLFLFVFLVGSWWVGYWKDIKFSVHYPVLWEAAHAWKYRLCQSYYFQENADADENDYFQEFGHLDGLFEETCAGDLLKTEFSFTPIKKKEKELKENREKAREDARKNRVSEKIPVSGKELGLYLYEKHKADEPDPLGLSDLEKKTRE